VTSRYAGRPVGKARNRKSSQPERRRFWLRPPRWLRGSLFSAAPVLAADAWVWELLLLLLLLSFLFHNDLFNSQSTAPPNQPANTEPQSRRKRQSRRRRGDESSVHLLRARRRPKDVGRLLPLAGIPYRHVKLVLSATTRHPHAAPPSPPRARSIAPRTRRFTSISGSSTNS